MPPGAEGFIAAGPRGDTAVAMEAAGAAFCWLDPREIAARIPFVAPPWKHGVLDPLGGSLRIRRALTALARRVAIHRAEVASVAGDGSVTLPDGTLVRGDRVLICAGVQTAAPFGPLGVEFAPHTLVTYQGADATGAARLSVPEGYGLPLGSTGRWAFGQQCPNPRPCTRRSRRSRRWARWTASRSAPGGSRRRRRLDSRTPRPRRRVCRQQPDGVRAAAR